VGGSFTATIANSDTGEGSPTLANIINSGLLDLRRLGILGPISSDDSGDFETEIVISAVPVPQGLILLLGALGIGAAVCRKRIGSEANHLMA